MTTKFILTFLLFGFTIYAQSQTDDIIQIIPNTGIDHIELLKSNSRTVSRYKGFKFYKFTDKTRCGRYRGRATKFTTFRNDQLGIEFVFFQIEQLPRLSIWDKKQLIEIRITNIINSSDKLKVGVSHKNDVIQTYGSIPKNWKHQSYLYYNDLGIAFDFNEEDIVTQINIFKI